MVRWPSARYRAGLRAVLGVTTDTKLGFYPPRRSGTTVTKALDTALGADGGLLAAWEAANRAGPDRADTAVPVSVSRQPEAVEVALVSAANESARLLAWTEASNIGDLILEQMHSEVRWMARSYLKAPTLPLFAKARAIGDQAFALLAGHQRPDQSRDLYAAAGWALTLLAWISTDLGRPDAAHTHARAAWVCADNANHHGLRAWIPVRRRDRGAHPSAGHPCRAPGAPPTATPHRGAHAGDDVRAARRPGVARAVRGHHRLPASSGHRRADHLEAGD